MVDVFVLLGNNGIKNVTNDVEGELKLQNENVEGDTLDNYKVHSFIA